MSEINNNYKEVDFHSYCPKCKNEKVKEEDDPCYECLQEPCNLNSSKPVNYEAKE